MRLGHGLFDMLQREQRRQQQDDEREERRRQLALRTDMQPAQHDSDSDGFTDELEDDDVELNEFACFPCRHWFRSGKQSRCSVLRMFKRFYVSISSIDAYAYELYSSAIFFS